MYLSQETSPEQILLYEDSRKFYAILCVSIFALSLVCSGSIQGGYFIASQVDRDETHNDLSRVFENITFDECVNRCNRIDREKLYEQAYLLAVTKYFTYSNGFTEAGKKQLKSEFMSRKTYDNFAVSFFEAANTVIERMCIDTHRLDMARFLAFEAVEQIANGN